MGNTFAPDYNDVPSRIKQFRDKHPEGSLQPADLTKPYTIETFGSETFIVYCAAAFRTPDDPRPGVGIAWEPVPGKTPFTRGSEIQNAETSAWGRALVAVLAADTKRISSDEEIRSARTAQAPAATAPSGPPPAPKERIDPLVEAVQFLGLSEWVKDQGFDWPWSDAVCDAIRAKCDELGGDEPF